MKSISVISYCILVLILQSKTFAQYEKYHLRINVTSVDSTRIYNAEVYLDDLELKYSKRDHSYVLDDWFPIEERNYVLTIKHNDYKTRSVNLAGDDFKRKGGNGRSAFAYCVKDNLPIYIFNGTESFFIEGTDSFPFIRKPELLMISRYALDKRDSAMMLFEDLKLEIVDTTAWQFITLRKKNGKNFKSKNCKELKAIRESGYVIQAGAVVANSVLMTTIDIGCKKSDLEQVKAIMKKKGFTYISKGNLKSTYKFEANAGAGYYISDISTELLQYEEIFSVYVHLAFPTRLF